MATKPYTAEQIEIMFNNVLRLIKFEKMSLSKALLEPDTPAKETFYKWISDDESRANRYAHACEARADLIFEEMIEIADDGKNDYMKKISKSGEEYEALNAEHVQRSKLRLDTRKWILSKMNPKKYGDKIDVTSGGETMNERPQFLSVDKTRKFKDSE